jgi:hypothetical protein
MRPKSTARPDDVPRRVLLLALLVVAALIARPPRMSRGVETRCHAKQAEEIFHENLAEGLEFHTIYTYNSSTGMPLFSQCATTAVCYDGSVRRRKGAFV